MTCGKSWGVPGSWWFCTRERGHEGNCINVVYGGKKPDDLFYEQQPEAIAANAKQREDERRERAKKGLVLSCKNANLTTTEADG